MNRLRKKLAISQEELDQLNALEQNAVLGGYGIDVNNNNTVQYCYCTYDNTSAITNTNEADGCYCVCRTNY